MKKASVVFLCVLMLSVDLVAQQVIQFDKALWAPVNMRYGREALYTDPLAYHYYTGSLQSPKADLAFKLEDSESTWKAVLADSAMRLIRPGLTRGSGGFGRGGYFYITYSAAKEAAAILNIRGNSGLLLNGASHAGDPYNSGWMHIPVKLKKGLNEFYVRGNFIVASLSFPKSAVQLSIQDSTVPSIVVNHDKQTLKAAVVVVNTSNVEQRSLQIESNVAGKKMVTRLPVVPAMSTRKVIFDFDPGGVNETGKINCDIILTGKGISDKQTLTIEAVTSTDKYSRTFISDIDGSLQYFAVAPQTGGIKKGNALFLSVHGAGVEAIGQARAYQSKDWGTIITPTNRRPRGFNWEDWGRLDALEVLALGRQIVHPDPSKVYLTGHSMGGHGTWFLGATYPDKWAAIAPCAGYPTLKGYGSADGLVPDSSNDKIEQVLLRASNQSDVPQLATNYKPLGVYIFHGDADRVVSVNYARQMKKQLADFHADMSYYEYPGGEHWFGDISVDWKPLFDYFKWHQRKPDSSVHVIDFKTANPGISSSYYWARIVQQQQPLKYSRIQLRRDMAKSTINGSADNTRMISFDLSDFGNNKKVTIKLNDTELSHTTRSSNDSIVLQNIDGKWSQASMPSADKKGPHRYGTFKDAFNYRMVFVYGTKGTKEENEWSLHKAKYDAETWYYRGNGAVEIISDKEYSLQAYKDRGVIIYGNKTTNAAYALLLQDSPIQIERNRITAGSKEWTGDDLAAYFVRPIKGSSNASVAVIAGTGLKGMNAATANQYFAGASGFPDFMIFKLDMLLKGPSAIEAAGFFDNDWNLTEGSAQFR